MVNSPTELVEQETITLDVNGMKCAGCVTAVERQLKKNTGVRSVSVNLATEIAIIECELGKVDAEIIAQKLTESGFPTQPRYPDQLPVNPTEIIAKQRQEIRQQITQLTLALVLIILSGLGHFFPENTPILTNIWFHAGLATVALLIPGRDILIDGWRGLWHRAPNMNTLVGLGALSAYTASILALLFPPLGWDCFFDEPVMLLGFILLGKTLEKQAKIKAASALKALIALQPTTARLIGNDPRVQGIEIPADRVKIGECLQVLPGEKIPVDGEILEGKTTVNESMLTGESYPVFKQPNDQVSAGTINLSGAIILKAIRTGKTTTLAHIVGMVETAQTRKAPIQFLADQVAGYFVYGVMTIATLTFLFWYFLGTHFWPEVLQHTTSMEMLHHGQASPVLLSLKLAIAVLVIACPCALGLATPTAILVGSGMGAERGLLIRGGDVLEQVYHLNTIIFDKTGTLTTGELQITDYLILNDHDFSWINFIDKDHPHPHLFYPALELLQLAATVESGSSHPIAKSICQVAKNHDLSLREATDFQTEPGLGALAMIGGKKVLVGNLEWLENHQINCQKITPFLDREKMYIYVAMEQELKGVIGLRDTLREDAQNTVKLLKERGLRVMMITGDRQNIAEKIAEDLDIEIENILSEIKPHQKAQIIRELQQKGERIGMVGDGINDAPALAQADVGIALQGGTDVAVETAKIVLMRGQLIDVVHVLELGKATFNKIQQNLFWAFLYNSLGIPIAAGLLLPFLGILLSPSIAGALMAFSSVSVVTNSLLLRYTFRQKLENQSRFSPT